jgi:LCP family protein required for cell wall assembly
MSKRRRLALMVGSGVLVVVLVGGGGLAWLRRKPDHPAVIVQYTGPTTSRAPDTTTPLPTAPPDTAAAPVVVTPGPPVGLKVANGQPAKPAIDFHGTMPSAEGVIFVLVLGSDARPNEDLLKTRTDSIHLIAINAASGQGTIVGFPRDSYVQFPDGGRGRINDALTRGGPKYVAETVRRLSGLPVHYVVLTGFIGLQKMVDELGGIDVFVPQRMNDSFSGARFQAGWHRFAGGEALAFSRNRHDVPNGDFSRSENQGSLLLAALSKMRSEVADDDGLLRWLSVMRKNCWFDVPLDHMPRLAALARRIEPEKMKSVVLPGRIGNAGAASVVYLTQDAPALFADLRDDGVIGTASPPTTTSTSTSAPPTTSAPPPTSSTTTTPAPVTTSSLPI